MLLRDVKADSTDISVVIRIVDSVDGTPETGVVFNTAGIDLQYRREGAASVAITEATLAALTTAHTDGGFLHIGNGYYRLDVPDAAFATGAAGVLIHGTVTGMVVIGCYVQIRTNLVSDVYTRIGAPAGASIAADIAAIEAQTDDIGVAGAGLTAVPWNAAWDAEVQSEVTDALDADSDALDAGTAQAGGATTITLRAAASAVDDIYNGAVVILTGGTGVGQDARYVTDYVGLTKVATVTPAWITNPDVTSTYEVQPAGGHILTTAGVVANVTRWNGTAVPAEHTVGYPVVTVKDGAGTGEIDTSAGAVRLSAASIDNILDEDLAGHTTANTLGKVLSDILADTGTDGVVLNAAGLATDAATEIATAIRQAIVTEAGPTLGAAPTVEQLLVMIGAKLGVFKLVRTSTTLTAYRSDETTVIATWTLDSATAPTSVDRAS